MRIERLSLYILKGIASLPAETSPLVEDIDLELPAFGISGPGQTARVTAVITTDVDVAVLATDRRTGIANLILSGAGIAGIEDSDVLDAEIGRIRSQRREQFSNGPYLVFRLAKEVGLQPSDPAMGVVNAQSFDLIVEGPRLPTFVDFQKQAREVELRVLGALKLMVNSHLIHQELSAATYLTIDDRIEYRLWFEAGSVDVSVALNLTSEAAHAMAVQVATVLNNRQGSSVLDLVGRASVQGVDQTVEFLVCFTALEQYIKRTIRSGGLVARFKKLAANRSPASEAAADVEEFRTLYAVRNDLAHEGHLPTDRGYANRARALLARYLT